MSFSGTPLGQGRRLDHNTFLNKKTLARNHSDPSTRTVIPPKSPQHSIPTSSYAYGAPTAGSKSPAKPKSSASTTDELANDETSLVRHARLKRERSLQSQLILNPDKWGIKDTSVNIATAFNLAASTSHQMHPNDPNNAWVSGSQTNLNVPRSTSVDYEKETHSTSSRRLAPPPNRLSQRNSRVKPLLKQNSTLTHVSDSEAEDNQESPEYDHSARGKSPFEQVVDISKRALTSATSFYMRPRSTEPADMSASANGKESSYDYALEEQEYQDMMRQKEAVAASRRSATTHKRNRMSMDNKAYRPSQSDMEGESDDGVSDDGRKRRRKVKKKDLGGGPLTTLPVAGYNKRRKKKGGKGNAAEGEEEDESSSGSEHHSSAQRASVTRDSVTRISVPPPARSSISRTSVPPQYDDPIDVEVGLDSIPEIDEPPCVDGLYDTSDRPSRSFSIGGVTGLAVNRAVRLMLGLMAWVIRILTLISLVLGRILGSIFDIIFIRPAVFFSSMNARPFITLCTYLFLAAAIYTAWQFRDPFLQMLPARSPQYRYYAPDTPITNLDELGVRLQYIEAALSGLSLDQQRARTQQDLEARAHGDVVNRIFALEARIRDEAKRVSEAEAHLKSSSSQIQRDLKQEIQALQSQLSAVESAPKETVTSVLAPHPSTHDEEARAKLRILEDRLRSVEGGVKHLEQAKHAGQAPANIPSGPAWWSKLASTVSTGGGLTIKSTDGSDITSLISQLVDTVARYGTQDFVSRADFALHSAGARPIPHLTSGTLELRPRTLKGQILGLITGYGYEVGRSPITALHQDLHSGNCWPMTGSYGQLGVLLALPAIISDITIDHVAKEVAFDLSTAPREMEVWGLVEGKENLEKVAAWQAEQAMRRQAAEEAGETISEVDAEDVYPPTLPKDVPFIRLASFTYDVHAHSNIQTFPVRQEIRDLDLDFGIVALVIKNNWGKDGYTCLYRFRVHGESPGGASLPSPPDNS